MSFQENFKPFGTVTADSVLGAQPKVLRIYMRDANPPQRKRKNSSVTDYSVPGDKPMLGKRRKWSAEIDIGCLEYNSTKKLKQKEQERVSLFDEKAAEKRVRERFERVNSLAKNLAEQLREQDKPKKEEISKKREISRKEKEEEEEEDNLPPVVLSEKERRTKNQQLEK